MASSLTLSIVNPKPCYKAGDMVCVELSMQPTTNVTGFQAFLQYNNSLLTFVPGSSSYTTSPFPLHIQPMATAEVAPGDINLDGSDLPNTPGTNMSALLATLCFTVKPGNDGAITSFAFRAPIGPFQSELSFQGNPVPTMLAPSGSFAIDQTAPDITCPAALSGLQCDGDVPLPVAPPFGPAPAAANNCANAPAICVGTYSGSTAAATNDGSAACGSSLFSADVWYRYTPGANGNLTVRLCGSTYDTVVSVHADSCPGSFLNQLGCNDDSCGFQSELTVAVSAFTTYLIRVSGFNGDSGAFTLEVSGPQCLNATDNCGGVPAVNWVSDVSSGTCPRTVTRTYRATDTAGNTSDCTQLITVDDTIRPDIVCPDPLVLNCSSPIPPPAMNLAQFQAIGGDASDNCGPVGVSFLGELTIGGGCMANPLFIVRTYEAQDPCGNTRQCKQTITVADLTPPTISCSLTGGGSADAMCRRALNFTATVDDFCCVDEDAVAVIPSVSSGSAMLSGLIVNKVQVNGQQVTVSGSVLVTLTSCSATIGLAVSAMDCCGNAATNCTDSQTVTDTSPPTVLCANVTQNADAGGCTALVTMTASATDNCATIPGSAIKFTIDANHNGIDGMDPMVMGSGSMFVFSPGVTLVRASADDGCGNIGTCDFTVTINAFNNVSAAVRLIGVDASMATITRCIKFTAKNGMTCAADVHVLVMFNGNPAQGTANFTVQCGNWTSLCGKDEQHTLYDAAALSVSGPNYVTASTLLSRGGDTDNNSQIDINDVTWLVATFGNAAAVGGCPWDGTRDADFSDNGAVGSEDYNILATNWLQFTTCPCVSPLRGAEPTTATFGLIDVAQLAPQVADAVDLNRDGIFDANDVQLFETAHGLSGELSRVMTRPSISAGISTPKPMEVGQTGQGPR